MVSHGYDFLSDYETAERRLAGGATVVGEFNNPQIRDYPEIDFSIHPGREIGYDFEPDLRGMLDVARLRFPRHRIDVSVRREPFTANVPESFSTSQFGIHADGFEDGFFVFSTDEPTVFYNDVHGTNPKQARPGELVYVHSNGFHSSPNPSHDGERVRIKFMPQMPSGGAYGLPAGDFVDWA